jgi:hypothetical protein
MNKLFFLFTFFYLPIFAGEPPANSNRLMGSGDGPLNPAVAFHEMEAIFQSADKVKLEQIPKDRMELVGRCVYYKVQNHHSPLFGTTQRYNGFYLDTIAGEIASETLHLEFVFSSFISDPVFGGSGGVSYASVDHSFLFLKGSLSGIKYPGIRTNWKMKALPSGDLGFSKPLTSETYYSRGGWSDPLPGPGTGYMSSDINWTWQERLEIVLRRKFLSSLGKKTWITKQFGTYQGVGGSDYEIRYCYWPDK